MFRPFRAGDLRAHNPGRCPGLQSCRPVGAKSDARCACSTLDSRLSIAAPSRGNRSDTTTLAHPCPKGATRFQPRATPGVTDAARFFALKGRDKRMPRISPLQGEGFSRHKTRGGAPGSNRVAPLGRRATRAAHARLSTLDFRSQRPRAANVRISRHARIHAPTGQHDFSPGQRPG